MCQSPLCLSRLSRIWFLFPPLEFSFSNSVERKQIITLNYVGSNRDSSRVSLLDQFMEQRAQRTWGSFIYWFMLPGGTWLNIIQTPVQVGAPCCQLGSWECVGSNSDCFGEHGLLSLLSFLKSPSVSGDIPKILVTDPLKVTMWAGGQPSQSHLDWKYQKRVLAYLGSLAIYSICLYCSKHLLTMSSWNLWVVSQMNHN